MAPLESPPLQLTPTTFGSYRSSPPDVLLLPPATHNVDQNQGKSPCHCSSGSNQPLARLPQLLIHPFPYRIPYRSSKAPHARLPSPRSMEVRGLLCSLLLPVPGAPALRLALAEAGDAMLPAPVTPPPAPAALPETSSRGLTLVAVRVIRPDTAIGCDSLCCAGLEGGRKAFCGCW